MTTSPMSCVLARFVNDPTVPTPDSIAREITSTVEFYGSDGRRLFFLDARWGDTDQPQPGQTTIPLLSVDFKVGQTRELDLAMKLPHDADCHGINNDSYAYSDMKDPRWRLSGNDFWAIVRLRGPYVDKRWRFDFRNPGAGQNLETLGSQEI